VYIGKAEYAMLRICGNAMIDRMRSHIKGWRSYDCESLGQNSSLFNEFNDRCWYLTMSDSFSTRSPPFVDFTVPRHRFVDSCLVKVGIL
jgi:hypothetical protein